MFRMKSVLEVPTVQPLHKHARMVVAIARVDALKARAEDVERRISRGHRSAVTDNVTRDLADPAACDTTARTSC